MQIIEKPWEKVNLGVDAVEYIFTHEDGQSFNCADLESIVTKGDFDYRVARIPADEMEIVWSLYNQGFQFVEATIELKCSLRSHDIPKQYKKYLDNFHYEEADEKGLSRIYSEIEQGLYSNDRVAVDPLLGIEKSSRRFSNWLKSEVANATSKVFLVYFGENEIGYFAVKTISPNEYSSIQAGLFKEWKDSGLGFSTLLFPIEEAKKSKKSVITTAVSSNNVISVKTHISVGYQLTDIKYVLVKHE